MTMFLERYNVHVVKLGHKVFYDNYVCDTDQLKGKPMLNLAKHVLCGSMIYMSIFANCYDYSTHLRVVQLYCHSP